MSVKEDHKHEKSKKATYVRSERYEDSSDKCVSSLSSHYGQLRSRWTRLLQEKEDALRAIRNHE